MDVRRSADPRGFGSMKSDELRASYLIDSLFVPDAVPMVYSDIDRSITGTAVPVRQQLALTSSKKEMAAAFFAERREAGIINIGAPGVVSIDGREFPMAPTDMLYCGRGSREIVFRSADPAHPAKFYFVSYPAHQSYPSIHLRKSDAESVSLGSAAGANKRTIYKYIRPPAVQSCQLVMGMTVLEEGSVWNTMPPHTHQRRSEVYMYFNLPAGAALFHFMGEPGQTRHIVMKNEQAVLSPSWSIHAGVATSAYSFVWAMGGENQAFDDMDGVDLNDLT
jgi:4-deoxy-L-threo-5-hexosulose-uronate ketol-isomerase